MGARRNPPVDLHVAETPTARVTVWRRSGGKVRIELAAEDHDAEWIVSDEEARAIAQGIIAVVR